VSTRLNVRVTPRASKTAIEGFRAGALVVKVTAPPVDSAANEAVVALIAEALDIPKRQISIARGSTGRHKVLDIDGVSQDQLISLLSR
jgi:uncharacterized protein (TIGR00251 family)